MELLLVFEMYETSEVRLSQFLLDIKSREDSFTLLNLFLIHHFEFHCIFPYNISIHGSLTSSGTNQGVYLVYEEDNTPLTAGNFVDNRLESLLKLALVLGSCHQGSHIQGV